jgi:hypothetical protein
MDSSIPRYVTNTQNPAFQVTLVAALNGYYVYSSLPGLPPSGNLAAVGGINVRSQNGTLRPLEILSQYLRITHSERSFFQHRIDAVQEPASAGDRCHPAGSRKYSMSGIVGQDRMPSSLAGRQKAAPRVHAGRRIFCRIIPRTRSHVVQIRGHCGVASQPGRLPLWRLAA